MYKGSAFLLFFSLLVVSFTFCRCVSLARSLSLVVVIVVVVFFVLFQLLCANISHCPRAYPAF